MSSFGGMAQPYTSTSLVSEEMPYAAEPMMVSYWALAGSQRGGLTKPRSVRRFSVLTSGTPRGRPSEDKIRRSAVRFSVPALLRPGIGRLDPLRGPGTVTGSGCVGGIRRDSVNFHR